LKSPRQTFGESQRFIQLGAHLEGAPRTFLIHKTLEIGPLLAYGWLPSRKTVCRRRRKADEWISP
jgi:hypothetical protein